ncbi:helix-turn-helix transcriptional regulator [Paenibacillus agri]|uniref:AraC family transcriptional regulator n=1 Tax=Paenibacillus agri TaxID=2744309 RepID=A0A850ER43_9BACL|nr:AraC family transcriptional regulator [Paenibacillus agri]NUU62250.1 AraC family transcriptional regulator [Paenibacillus agri]
MTYPKELKEYPQLEQKTYPFRLFINDRQEAKAGENILFIHWHEHFEIIVMQRGSAIFHVDSHPYEVEAGEVLFVPSGGLHVGYCLKDGPLRYTSIVFHGSLFEDWKQDPQHEQFVEPYVSNRYQFPVRPAEHMPSFAAQSALLQSIIEEDQVKGPAYQLAIKNYLHLLFTLLSRNFLPQQLVGSPKEHHSFNRERFKPLLTHVEEHFADKITIEQAAKTVNLNPYHFCKTFKKLTGRTFIDYVNLCRVNEAERLLLESNLSITEIAGRVGCDNPNYFTKLFKQYKGMTPSGVRKV